MRTGIIVLVLLCIVLADARKYLFDRAICTGLGDRVGSMLTLAALARMKGVQVVFGWCNDPSEVYSRLHQHIPRWTGYNYSLTEFIKRFNPPSEIIIVERITEKHKRLPRVQWEGIGIPAEYGSDSVYTIAWKTTRLGAMKISAQSFAEAYHGVSRSIGENARQPYIAVHLRGPDDNTYSPPLNAWDNLEEYCTGKVLKRLMSLNMTLIAISNNRPWANELLGKHLHAREQVTAYDDFSLLLGASAIVQHAWGGWSSFSSVPALASQIPIINTFRGVPHRHQLFLQQGGLPIEMYNCDQQSQYMQAVKTTFDGVKLEL